MKNWRAGLLFVATIAIAFGTSSLWAMGETIGVCCTDPSDCSGKICCPWDWVSGSICDVDNQNFCVAICIHPGGN